MKYFLLLSALCILFWSCKKNTSEIHTDTIISGFYKNHKETFFNVLDAKGNKVNSIQVSQDGKFIDTLTLQNGYYYLKNDSFYIPLYINPDTKMHLDIDSENKENTIIFSGDNHLENQFLIAKEKHLQSFGELNYYGHYAKLEEKDFLQLTDSIINSGYELIKSQENLDPNFKKLEKARLKIDEASRLTNYQAMRRFVTGDQTFEVSKTFPNGFKNIDLNDEVLLKVPNYIFLVEKYYESLVMESSYKKDSLDFYVSFLKLIDTKIENKKIKEEIAYNTGLNRINYTTDLSTFYNTYTTIATNQEYKTQVEKKYMQLKKVEKGALSTSFTLLDTNETPVTLEDLRGNVVYIDIWATWCLPCIKEIPTLKKIEKEFESDPVKFVSIAKNDNKESWLEMVTNKELGGIQLFAPDENIDFFKNYLVQGIPRYILIDKEGHIFDANAKRPSNPTIINEIKSLLQ